MKLVNGLMCLCLLMITGVLRADEPSTSSEEMKNQKTSEIPERRILESSIGRKETSIPSKVNRYAKYLLTKYDRNHDGVLQKDEWMAMHGHPELMDFEGTGDISLEELARWIANYGQRKRIGVPRELESQPENSSQAKMASPKDESPDGTVSASTPSNSTPGEHRRDQKFVVPANRLPAGLPEWFLAKDQDGDGQLTVGEFSPTGTAADQAEFATYDANGDGVITAKECVHKATTKETNDSRTNSTDQTNKKQSRKKRTPKNTP